MANNVTNARSVEYTGNTTFPFNANRNYFFITVTTGAATIQFGDPKVGEVAGLIPLAVGEHYVPSIGQAAKITVTTSGTFIVHSDVHETL